MSRLFVWGDHARQLLAWIKRSITKPTAPDSEYLDDLIIRLKTRAAIRRQISSRKSVQEGKPDRISDLLDEASAAIGSLKKS